MSRDGRAALMLCLGVVTLRLVYTGGFGWFVQQRMRWPLVAAAVVLVAFGAFEVISAWRADATADHDDHDDLDHADADDPDGARGVVGDRAGEVPAGAGLEHEDVHEHDGMGRRVGPRVGWLLGAPLLVLIAVAPTGLGAAAAERVDAYTPTEDEGGSWFEPLPESEGPVPLPVSDFVNRAIWDSERTLEDREVVLEGLVVNDAEVADGFLLTRFLVFCCAADGLPVQVAALGADQAYEDDTWVRVTGVWRPPASGSYEGVENPRAELDVTDIELVPDPPDDPYENPF
ncbi:MAG: TIGR03943 family protein [Actinomycetota bacterium]|nr:TIGR03943 family protein [Actinomycetota bacterium]